MRPSWLRTLKVASALGVLAISTAIPLAARPWVRVAGSRCMCSPQPITTMSAARKYACPPAGLCYCSISVTTEKQGLSNIGTLRKLHWRVSRDMCAHN